MVSRYISPQDPIVVGPLINGRTPINGGMILTYPNVPAAWDDHQTSTHPAATGRDGLGATE